MRVGEQRWTVGMPQVCAIVANHFDGPRDQLVTASTVELSHGLKTIVLGTLGHTPEEVRHVWTQALDQCRDSDHIHRALIGDCDYRRIGVDGTVSTAPAARTLSPAVI